MPRARAESHVEVQRSIYQQTKSGAIRGPGTSCRRLEKTQGPRWTWTFRTRPDRYSICASPRPRPQAPAASCQARSRPLAPRGRFTSCLAGLYPKNFPSLLGLGTGSGEGQAGGGLQGTPSPDLTSYPSQMEGVPQMEESPLPSPSQILRVARGAGARRQRGAWRSERNKGSARAGEDAAFPFAPPSRLPSSQVAWPSAVSKGGVGAGTQRLTSAGPGAGTPFPPPTVCAHSSIPAAAGDPSAPGMPSQVPGGYYAGNPRKN
ncbi:hypothetical protein P7K49_029499 [Saguinus oedipus]|uniref:Uncharacterized protein n=1 Tax=Saguinus oedipus TaxID=9490 RepID=A0ABQ9U851_SAGOE|nr:hypothetical protein P7K49_029499 [Saguinus oedipus]